LVWRRGNPGLELLFTTRLVSQTAQALFFGWLFTASGSGTEGATQLGSAVIAMMVASILLGLPGGALADALGPRWALPTGGSLRLFAALLASSLLSGAPWAGAFMYSAASQVFSPAELALVRAVEPRRLLSSHAALLVLQYIGFALGALVLFPLLDVFVAPWAPLTGAVILFGATVLITLALGARLADMPPRAPTRVVANPLVQVFTFFKRDRLSLYAAGVLAFADMATRSLLLALPLYLLAELKPTTLGIAALMSAASLGGLVGLAWVKREQAAAPSPDRLIRMLRATMVAVIASTLALAMLADALRLTFSYSQLPDPSELQNLPTLSFAVALPVFAILGLALTATPVLSRGLLSARAPALFQARTFAAQGTMSNLLVVLPLTIATVGADLVGTRATLLFLAITGGLALIALERALRGYQGTATPEQGAG
jgi:MFS family permease